jgi:hypothetical protein
MKSEVKKLKALGFIEVLIAIVVVGIVSAVFLSIAGTSMKELIQTERIEYMARIAKDGFNIAQEIANQEKANLDPEVEYFPMEATDQGQCFIPLRVDSGSTSYEFYENGSNVFEQFSDPGVPPLSLDFRNDRVDWFNTTFGEENNNYFWGDNYFMFMCIDSIDTDTSRWASVHFVVGDRDVAGQVTNDSDVKDFIYYAVIEL